MKKISLKELLDRKSPYRAISEWIRLLSYIEKQLGEDKITMEILFYAQFIKWVINFKNIKNFQFDEDLLNLINKSKFSNEIFDYKIFPIIFINNRIKISKKMYLAGILFIDNNILPQIIKEFNESFYKEVFYQGFSKNLLTQIQIDKENLIRGDVSVVYLGYDINDISSFGNIQPSIFHKHKIKLNFDTNLNLKTLRTLYNSINIYLTSKSSDVSVIQIDKTEQHKKQLKHNKIIDLTQYNYIKLINESQIYAREFSESLKKKEYQQCVMGHFKTFKAKRYKNSYNKTSWVFPYIRGRKLPKRPNLIFNKVQVD